MLDLKNCPFCGGKATLYPPYGALGAWISCAGCGLEGPTETGVTAAEAIAAWNRRALQAVGPEPAVAVKPLIWTEDRDDDGTEIHRARGGEVNLPYTIYEDGFIKKPFGLSLNQLRIGSFDTVEAAKAAAEADYASRIRSALVATPPAEPVVEALREYADPRNWVVNGRFDPHSGNFDGTSFAVAALATKPAVKDDETVVEARKRLERAGGAMSNILYNLKQDPTFAEALRDRIAECQEEWDAALAAKDGRS